MRYTAWNIALFILAAVAVATGSPIAGTWTANLHDLPAVRMTVEDSGGKLSGTIVFYYLMQENGVWKVVGDAKPTEMMNPRLEGKTFSFEVPHAKKHGSTDPADQEIITMHFHLTVADEGVFQSGKNGQELKLTRH